MWEINKNTAEATAANESLEVLFSYVDGYTRPIQLRYEGEVYELGGVQFWYAEHKNGSPVHHYTVGDLRSHYTFELVLETENLTWRLQKAVPVKRGLDLGLSHRLVGAV